jgi:hypothetical protein
MEQTADVISKYDFDVSMPAGPKGKPATLTVTREGVIVLQKGKKLVDIQIQDVRSWGIGEKAVR